MNAPLKNAGPMVVELPGGYFVRNPEYVSTGRNAPVEIYRIQKTLPDGTKLYEVVARFTLSDGLGFAQAKAFAAAMGELRSEMLTQLKGVTNCLNMARLVMTDPESRRLAGEIVDEARLTIAKAEGR